MYQIGYYALTVSLVNNFLPEQSFRVLEEGVKSNANNWLKNEIDIAVLRDLRTKGMTYREIGELYGTSDTMIYRTLKWANRKAGVL